MKNRAQTAQTLQNVFCPFFKKKRKAKFMCIKNTKQIYQYPARLQEKLHIKNVCLRKQKKNESTNLHMQLSCFLPPIKKKKNKTEMSLFR